MKEWILSSHFNSFLAGCVVMDQVELKKGEMWYCKWHGEIAVGKERTHKIEDEEASDLKLCDWVRVKEV